MALPRKPCRDCLADAAPMPARPAPHPGPRCATHHRVEQRRRSAVAHERRVQATYHLAEGDYERLRAAQGGVCALCRRATGASKRLAVDHDHRTGNVRGLLCGPCNRILGHGRDDPGFFLRIIDYLANPPARTVLP